MLPVGVPEGTILQDSPRLSMSSALHVGSALCAESNLLLDATAWLRANGARRWDAIGKLRAGWERAGSGLGDGAHAVAWTTVPRLLVRVEPAADLAAQMSRLHLAAKQRAGAVLGVPETVVQDLEDR